MTQAMAVPANEVQSRPMSLVQDIPLSRIHESKTNPRRQFDELKLAELADNIRQHGVLQPVLVRPMPDGEPETYELVAGARRFRASKLAKRETIPASIRELTETQCLELQLIENLQRADVHELDEARGYAALMQLQPENYTVEVLAEKIGRSEKYVYARLRLMHLIDEGQEAFYVGRLTVAHAFEIARLQPNDQRRALQECFPNHRSTASALKDRKAEAVTVRELRAWIENEVLLDLSHAPFDPQAESLLPPAGSCTRCPKRTGNNPMLFPEVQRKSICTDPSCYRMKIEALVQIRIKPLEEKGEKPLRVSQAPAWQTKSPKADVLYDGQYRTVKKAECSQTKPAVVVDGSDAGTLLHGSRLGLRKTCVGSGRQPGTNHSTNCRLPCRRQSRSVLLRATYSKQSAACAKPSPGRPSRREGRQERSIETDTENKSRFRRASCSCSLQFNSGDLMLNSTQTTSAILGDPKKNHREVNDSAELLTIKDVAQLLRVPVSWVYDRTRKRSLDRLPGIRLGKYWRFRHDDVVAWLRHQQP
jgi:ParB/RepB/Spo0J family partition protein/excisionase family DNA binding protein